MKQEWKQWEGRTVGGHFPLRQFLGGSDHGAVFLTERNGSGKCAIKLIPANPADAERMLAQWKRAATLAHPHLMQLFEMGRAQVDGADVAFVVMEYAEEDLSQILPQRPLTPGEAQDMLGPVVDVLGYLHGKGFVQGHLKPANILATGDNVKVSSDKICQIGERCADAAETDVYDPPERARGKSSAAGDVWSLGVTLTEVLTRQLPKPNGKDHGELKLPEGLSSPFLDIARNCLWRDPEQRWSVTEIASRLSSSSPVPAEKPVVAPAALPAVVPVAAQKPFVEEVAQPQSKWLWISIALVVAAIAGGWLVAHQRSENQPAVATETQQTASAAEATSGVSPATAPALAATQPEAQTATPKQKTAEPVAKPANADGDEIVERVVPSIPKSARDTIQGKVKVRVRVDVDASGKVVGTKFETHGPSQYFARQATQAAEHWKFAPAQDDHRHWLLLFEFGRGGTQAVPSRVTRGH